MLENNHWPLIVETDVVAEVLGEHGTMCRADDGDVECCRLLQK